MAQLTIYMPANIEKRVRDEARRSRKSVSAFITDLARRAVGRTAWPDQLKRAYGAWKGSFPKTEDLPPEDAERL